VGKLMRRLSTQDQNFKQVFAELLAFETVNDLNLVQTVDQIIADVRQHGDDHVLKLTQQFDRHPAHQFSDLELSQQQLKTAFDNLSPEIRDALELAAKRIRTFHEAQKQESWTYIDDLGNTLGQKVTPLDRVGIYVPGGLASYPSSVLMNAVPAHVAGVPEIIMVVPAPNGELNPLVLAAAYLAGVSRVFTIGGAQAVAALAYGTQTIPPVNNADWLAMDVLSQAEHDTVAQAIFITPDEALLNAVELAIEKHLNELPKADIARTSIENRGALILVKDRAEAIDLINQVAPEHLELCLDDAEAMSEDIRHAGAIFMGRYTPEAIGDYCAGPNHVLPTSGTARFSSPLGVYDFQKRSSLIMCSKDGVKSLAKTADILAVQENLDAHARSARYRYQ